MCAKLKTMRDVVAWLQFGRGEALLELREFEHAVDEIERNLAALGDTAQGFPRAVDEITREGGCDSRVNRLLREHAERQAATLAQIAAAFRELQHGVRHWGITQRTAIGRPCGRP